jgi:crossover junction endodeoxyribonuclease RusA
VNIEDLVVSSRLVAAHEVTGSRVVVDANGVRFHSEPSPPALELFVSGRPAPQGSKKHVGNGVMLEMSKAVAPWRTTVAWHAAQAHRTAPLDGPLRVEFAFVMPRPTSLPKRKATPPHIKRPDLDKLARAVMDALTGVVWRDDSQVNDLHPTKRYAELDEQPGVHIRVVTT